jgi:uncharacterized protein (TIGR02996 family)
MSASEDELVRAIVDDPADDATRLVYADWLEERGDPRAEYLRLEAQLIGLLPSGAMTSIAQLPIWPRLLRLAPTFEALWLEKVGRRFDVILVRPDGDWSNKVGVIKLVREIWSSSWANSHKGLKDAKDLVDASENRPMVLVTQISLREAERIRAMVGGLAEIDLVPVK